MSDLKELSLDMKKEAHGSTTRVREFEPLGEELRRLHGSSSSLRETMVPTSTLSKVLPSVFLRKIEVDNNPDSSAFLDDSSGNPHISNLQIVGKNQDGSLLVKRSPVTVGSLSGTESSRGQETVTVTVSLSVKQLFDDDDLVYDIVKTLGMDKYLKVKIFAVIDNEALSNSIKQSAKRRPDLLNTDPAKGIYVIGGSSGIPIPQDHSKVLSPTSNDFEMSIDGSLVKNTLIKKSFVLSKPPESMKVFSIAYYDVFESSDFDKEMDANLGALLDDVSLSKILIGDPKSEIVFQSGELLNEAAVFVESPPALGNLGSPYLGAILEVREGLYAKPARTSMHQSHGGHAHHYYVDKQGNGWTSPHTDSRGRQHIHMISSFRLSPSGRFDDLEEVFRPHSHSHPHSLPIAASNALYKKMVPIDYITDNRSKGSVGNLKVSLDKQLEDTFSFLKSARRRSNNIRPINGSSELAPITTRESTKKYVTPAMYSSDVSGNCRFTFAVDEKTWLSDNTAFGRYIADKSLISRYAKISSLKIFRKKINHYEYAGLKTFKKLDLGSTTGNPEILVCTATQSSNTLSGVSGVNQNASIVEYTPAGSQKSSSRHARYFMVVDGNYTSTSSSATASASSTGRVDNELPQLSSGIYAYSVELSIIDNTVEYFGEALRGLFSVVRKLEDYILIGSRRGNNTSVVREFTKSFRTKVMDDLCRDIVNESMRLLRRVFVDNSGTSVMTSDASFSQRANKIYMAIRPKSGSLFGAERYLVELKGVVEYLRGITRSDEVGKYGAQRSGTATNSSASGQLSDSANSRLKKAKFYFKKCFHRSEYLNGANSYFQQIKTTSTGLSSISAIALQESISNSKYSKSSYVLLEPQLTKSKLTRFEASPINESLIKKLFYGGSESGITPQAPTGTSVFQIVENKALLKHRTVTSSLEAISIRNIFGTTDLDDQIIDLQEGGYLERQDQKNKNRGERDLKTLVSGQELIETLQSFKEANSRLVRYFAGFRRIKNSFEPIFKSLSKSKLSALASEGRPVLCMLSGPLKRQYKDFVNYGGLKVYDEFFVVSNVGANVFSPTSPVEMPPLENILSTYDAELLTTDPTVSTADSAQASGTSMIMNMGTFTSGGSGGNY